MRCKPLHRREAVQTAWQFEIREPMQRIERSKCAARTRCEFCPHPSCKTRPDRDPDFEGDTPKSDGTFEDATISIDQKRRPIYSVAQVAAQPISSFDTRAVPKRPRPSRKRPGLSASPQQILSTALAVAGHWSRLPGSQTPATAGPSARTELAARCPPARSCTAFPAGTFAAGPDTRRDSEGGASSIAWRIVDTAEPKSPTAACAAAKRVVSHGVRIPFELAWPFRRAAVASSGFRTPLSGQVASSQAELRYASAHLPFASIARS